MADRDPLSPVAALVEAARQPLTAIIGRLDLAQSWGADSPNGDVAAARAAARQLAKILTDGVKAERDDFARAARIARTAIALLDYPGRPRRQATTAELGRAAGCSADDIEWLASIPEGRDAAHAEAERARRPA